MLIFFRPETLFFIAVFVFLAGAILFILRIVTLAFTLLVSPLAFAAAILPATNTYWNQWLSKLVGNAFVAPAYMLFLFAIIAIVQTKTQITNPQDTLANVFDITKPNYDYSVAGRGFLNYAIIIGLLLGAQKLAQTMASGIAGLSVKYAGKATGFAMGATAFGLRRTFGRGFQTLAGSERVKGWVKEQQDKGRFRGAMAQTLFRGTQFGAQSTFDVRAGRVGKATSGLAGMVGAEFGQAGGRGGFAAIEKAQIKSRVELGKALATTQKGSDERKQEDLVRGFQETLLEEERKLDEALKIDPTRKARLEDLRKNLKDAQDKGDTTLAGYYRGFIENEEGVALTSARQNLRIESTKLKGLADARVEIGKERAQSFAKREMEGFKVFGKEIPSRPFMRRAAREKAVDDFRKGEGEFDKLLKKVAEELKKNEPQKNEPPKTP